MREGRITLVGPADTFALGAALAEVLAAGDVVALSGPLGAGKTSLARGVLAGLGLAGDAPSPSFALVIAYEPPDVRLPLWHVDLFRLVAARELVELGLDDASAHAALLVEWPERAGANTWPEALRLALAPDAADGRCLTWRTPAAWEARWPPVRS